MTTEHHAWASLHPLETAHPSRIAETCPCGQDLDPATSRHHCPRCGATIRDRAA